MVKTRAMLSNDDPVTPPPPQRDDRPVIAKLLFPVPPQSAEKAPLSSPMQHEHDHSPKTKSRRIGNISDYTRIRLRRRIQKIYQMSTDVVEGYSTFYYNKHDKPLPQETVDKIMLLYHNRIERRCNEVGLTIEEEEQWDPHGADIDVYALSDSGEESEEHDSDDVNFYSDEDDDDDDVRDADDVKDKDHNIKAKSVDNGKKDGMSNLQRIANLEHDVKTLRANLEHDLVILQRMTSSPNRKNPYAKFEEWSAWKKNEVDQKVAAIKAQIDELKASNDTNKGDRRKGKRGNTKH